MQQDTIDPYLEQQYNNRAAVPEHPEIFARWQSQSAAYRRRVGGKLNIAYGESAREVLDIFPAAQQPAPVHLFIHGGYWQALSKEWFSFVAETFNRRGECAVILSYGLCPQVTVAQIIEQIVRAVEWLLGNAAQFGGDPARLQLTGHSAGGHLLACLLTHDWSAVDLEHPPFQQLNALSGLYELGRLLATQVNTALRLDHDTAHALSPLYQSPWRPDPATCLNLYVGELESDEYKKQSAQLQQAWSGKMEIGYQLIPQTNHFSILERFVQDHYRSLAE